MNWTRSNDGYCESKCGRFQVKPKFWGRVRPREFLLKDTRTGNSGLFDTQREAKSKAETIVQYRIS